jgi:hypothetical protein
MSNNSEVPSFHLLSSRTHDPPAPVDTEVRKTWDPLTYIPVRGERGQPEVRYREPFAETVKAGWLPGFEIYNERDHGADRAWT